MVNSSINEDGSKFARFNFSFIIIVKHLTLHYFIILLLLQTPIKKCLLNVIQ